MGDVLGRAQGFLMSAAVMLEDVSATMLERKQLGSQIKAFLANPNAPTDLPPRILHRFKPGILDGDAPPPTVKPEDFVCENVDLSWAIGLDELPAPEVRQSMPPHTVCPVCFPGS